MYFYMINSEAHYVVVMRRAGARDCDGYLTGVFVVGSTHGAPHTEGPVL